MGKATCQLLLSGPIEVSLVQWIQLNGSMTQLDLITTIPSRTHIGWSFHVCQNIPRGI